MSLFFDILISVCWFAGLYFGTNIDNITTGFVKKLVISFLLDVIDAQIMGKRKKLGKKNNE